MNYADFKAYLAVFLWKQNDADLVANMDTLIVMGESELNRVLDIQRRQKTALIAPVTQDHPLPADFRTIISVANNDPLTRGMMVSTTLQDVYAQRTASGSLRTAGVYAVDEGDAGQKLLRLVGPFSAERPGSMTLTYRCNVPHFKDTNASWLAEDFLDLYTYTVLSHCAPFLREDERIAVWEGKKGEAIMAAITEDKHMITHGGSPLQMLPHRRVP